MTERGPKTNVFETHVSKWSDRDVAILRLLIQKMREEDWTTGKLLEEAAKVFPERSANAVKQKMYLMMKRHEA